jgi:hypothetical protein
MAHEEHRRDKKRKSIDFPGDRMSGNVKDDMRDSVFQQLNNMKIEYESMLNAKNARIVELNRECDMTCQNLRKAEAKHLEVVARIKAMLSFTEQQNKKLAQKLEEEKRQHDKTRAVVKSQQYMDEREEQHRVRIQYNKAREEEHNMRKLRVDYYTKALYRLEGQMYTVSMTIKKYEVDSEVLKFVPCFAEAVKRVFKLPKGNVDGKSISYEESMQLLMSLQRDASAMIATSVNLSLENNELAKNYMCPLKGGIPDICISGPDGALYDYEYFVKYIQHSRFEIQNLNGEVLSVCDWKSPTTRITIPYGTIGTAYQPNSMFFYMRAQKTKEILDELAESVMKRVSTPELKLDKIYHDITARRR